MKNALGGIMMGCGILIGGLSGLCLVLGVLSTLTTMASAPGGDTLFYSLIALAGFSVPVAIGIGLFFAGRSLMNATPPAAAEPPVQPEEVKPATPPGIGNSGEE